MNNYRLINCRLVLGVVLVLFIFSCTEVVKMKNEADAAREKSDSIMRAFKTIDKDLQQSKERIDSFNSKLNESLQKKL